ncbi:MAG: hypothetical protein COW00_03665 [Bdellovibrio sp. CG12_big_fil_rev_8_21_14_0_65_39_13]|nr:MAG: hypothetical protein COW78_14770 [Bdellovibrio sp. CG22_combo_CG10-13_8_21_14_all_39_27]PIQ61460.1 MAG: hypothetical protein COW00_03665 [Bdellovibrio sp. CG12_big_fil_rev_8_21_14_0_65_39_13]PIR35306.1 MAG: hypothetical protein COV37_09430 [Bdellovibrio sp. CG11_big_fil_rev_8_21_14_0_20_39_38]
MVLTIKRSQHSSESGVAILLVISVIAILAYLLADLTYETNLNRIRGFNIQDKVQAKLNAESGLRLALTKLRLYKEGRNLLEKNDSAKGVIQPSTIEAVAISPFIFPIPNSPKFSLIQRTAVEEFTKKTFLKGELSLTIQAVRGFLNPNTLRFIKKKPNPDDPDQTNPDDNATNDDTDGTSTIAKTPQKYFETKLVDLLTRKIKEKSEEDDEFNAAYANTDPSLLVKELKYYVNAPNAYEEAEKAEIEALYSGKGLSVKHAPLTSIDELYALEGWTDTLVDLVKEELTVHETSIIAVNEITKEQLKLIFPNVTDEQSEEFFKYRDGDKQLQDPPHPFKKVEDFKEAIIGRFGIADNTSYDERMQELKNAGLQVGTAGKLYRVISVGKFNNSTYSITAYVDMPIKPPPPPKKKDPNDPNSTVQDPNDRGTTDTTDPNNPDAAKKEKIELLDPRIIEIRVGESS